MQQEQQPRPGQWALRAGICLWAVVVASTLSATAAAAAVPSDYVRGYVSWVEHRIDDQGLSGINLRGADGLAVDDLDDDGFPDVVAVHEDSDHVRISFGSGDPGQWANFTLASGSLLAGGVEDVDLGDVNGDGRIDVVTACEDGYLAYFEAPVQTREMGDWTATVLAETLNRGSWIRVKLADLNQDGQLEILGANKVGSGFPGVEPWTFSAFYLEGATTDPAAWSETVLGTRPRPINIRPVDIDDDGDPDVVGASRGNREIILFENLGGGASWAERMVYSGGYPNTQGFMMEFADLDGDGRLDLVVGDSDGGDGDVFWLKQPPDLADTWSPQLIGTIWPDDTAGLKLVDLNLDGRLDLFVGGYSRSDPAVGTPEELHCGRLAWFEQPPDVTGPWPRHDVSRRRAGMFDMFVPLDVDRDGAVDLVSTRGNSGFFDGLIWLERVITWDPPLQVFTPARLDDFEEIPMPIVSAVGDDRFPPQQRLVLRQNIPNPFNPITVIRFVLPEAATVTLRVYDVTGRLVRSLLDGAVQASGEHHVPWNGSDESGRVVAAGVYFYRLDVGDSIQTKRMLLLK